MEEETTGIVVNLTESFKLKLDRYLLDLREEGIKKTKSDLIPELAEEALLKRMVNHTIK